VFSRPEAPPFAGATVRVRLTEAASSLAAVSDTPRLDAELLMAHALRVERDAMLLGLLDLPEPAGFQPLLARRLAHEPVAYITGRRAFWTIELEVGPGVLIPRPDSETLVEAAVEHFGSTGPKRILDLGTGPGTLLLAVLDQWPSATGLGIDASEEALARARSNADRLGLADRAEFRPGNWADGVEERFHLILCNPPYVEEGADLDPQVAQWEPAEALFAGPDGLDAYRFLAPQLARLIAPGGIACVEVGAGQAAAVIALFEEQRLAARARNDLGGHARCVVLEL
jgi:release factor glutamine methyltransferase